MTKEGWVARATSVLTDDVIRYTSLSLVFDPDGMFAEAPVIGALGERGIAVLHLDDPVPFRLAYDREWRPGRDTGHLAVVAAGDVSEQSVPFDVLVRARNDQTMFHVSVPDVFPHLDAVAVRLLGAGDRSLWGLLTDPPLSRAGTVDPDRASGPGTFDIALDAMLHVEVSRARSSADVLDGIFAWHERSTRPVQSLADRLVVHWRRMPELDAWPVADLVADRREFLRFAHDGWVRHLRSIGWHDETVPAGLAPGSPGGSQGPGDTAFGDPRIAVRMERLYASGALDRVALVPGDPASVATGTSQSTGSVMTVGVLGFMGEDGAGRVRSAMNAIRATLPGADATYRNWLEFATVWARLSLLRVNAGLPTGHAVNVEMDALHADAELRFQAWLTDRDCQNYRALFTLTAAEVPATLDKVAGVAARTLGRLGRTGRVAVLVLDGMGLLEWELLRPVVERQLHSRIAIDTSMFAMVPTLTDVSRQAVFSGMRPGQDGVRPPERWLATTSREGRQWSYYWSAQERVTVDANDVRYLAQGVREPSALAADVQSAIDDRVRVLGIVAVEMDKIMHGSLGIGDHVTRIRDLATSPLAGIISQLARGGYTTFITSDHGSVETVGSGLFVRGGLTAVDVGSRVHVSVSPEARNHEILVAARDSAIACVPWPAPISDGYYPFFPPPGMTFGSGRARAEVTHGGISFEEVIIPFIRVEAS